MSERPRCAVIGAGVMGAAAAYWLARRGADVRLFEQFSCFHAKGSSHGATRLFRIAYFEHPDYVPLLQRSEMLWREVGDECGETLLHSTGALMAGPKESALMAGTRQAARDHDLLLEPLNAADIAEHFPWFAIPPSMEAFIEPSAGVLAADKAINAFLNGARAHGATIYDNCPISTWRSSKGEFEIVTPTDMHQVDRLIVTPGAWAPALLGSIGDLISPLRKTLFWTASDRAALQIGGKFLPFAIELDNGGFFYGFPAVDGDGIKIAEHTGGAPVSSPEDEAIGALEESRTRIKQFMSDYAPGLPSEITKEQGCLYSMSPDGHFIIDHHPDDQRIVFAVGFSGHGFKFAPVIGEALADLTLSGETRREFDFLKLSRFKT